MDEYITAAKAAKIYGLNPDYASRLAKRSYREGNNWPIKSGRTWIAPVNVWAQIFNPEGIEIRKQRKKKIIDQKKNNLNENLISASKAGKKYGYSSSWAIELAKRSRKVGNQWPTRVGNMWMAPEQEWEEIFNSHKLKKKTYKKKSKKALEKRNYPT